MRRRRAHRGSSPRGAAGLVAIALAAVLLAVAPANAEISPGEEPGSLAVSSPFPPFVIVKAGEAFQVDGTAVTCPTWLEVADLRIVSLGEDGLPNGFVDAAFPGDVPTGVPFDIDMSITLSPEAVQGTYELVALCESAGAPSSVETPGDDTPDESPGDDTPDETPDDTPGDDTPDETPGDDTPDETPGDDTTDETPGDDTPDETPGDETPDDAPIALAGAGPVSSADDAAAPREVLEIDAVIGATGWLVVGDENRLPPSSGTAEVPEGEIRIGETFSVGGAGFAGDSAAEVWLYSDPVLLGAAAATAVGALTWEGSMPTGTTLGAHTVVIAGQSPTGRPLFLTAGVNVGAAAAVTTTTTTAAGPTTPQATGVAIGASASGAPAGRAATPAASSGPLPATGFGNGGLTVVALLLLAGGAIAVLTSRRRIGTPR